MSVGVPVAGRGSRRGWDILLAAGLIAAVPNLLFAGFMGGWMSVSHHYPDAEPVSLLRAVLNYAPFIVGVAVLVTAIIVRVKRRVRLAALLMSLHLAVLAMFGGLFLPVLF